MLTRPSRTLLILMLTVLVVGCGTGPAEPSSVVAADSGAVPSAPINGMHEIMGDDGTLRMRGELRDGKRQGPWSSFFPNGSTRSRATYVDGLEEGATEVFHETGMTYYSGQYYHGKPVGEWVFNDPMGTPVKTVLFDSLGKQLEQR